MADHSKRQPPRQGVRPAATSVELDQLRAIKTFPQLVKYLRDDLDWPLESDSPEEIAYEYTPEELGLDPQAAVEIKHIRQLRPLASDQPWGIFFVDFEPKKLPVVVLRRILRSLVVNKRGAAKKSEQAAWNRNDLLFISAYGEGSDRAITFAHFADPPPGHDTDLPTLKVLGWDDQDTALHLDLVHRELTQNLRWPADAVGIVDPIAWRNKWTAAFKVSHGEVVRTSKDLAVRLAELAARIRKRARAVLSHESEKGPLRVLHKAFRESLIHDLSEDDFADMYAQTIAYGLLTAAVSRHAPDAPGVPVSADSVVDMVPVTNPFLKEMLERFLKAGGRNGHNAASPHKGIDFDEYGVSEVVDMLRKANMTAVLADFGNRNPLEDPVIHFYELFLKEYDPKKRMQRGVFYTPRPVVSFIVRSVHQILQKEFGLPDGLADTTTWGEMLKKHPGLKLPTRRQIKSGVKDPVEVPAVKPDDPFVLILDPATGTGTFLVEVIDLVYAILSARWKREGKSAAQIKELWNEYVPVHLLPRLHGYELMPAPYAIAHMKIGLKLTETGYKFESGERVRVYLTNALDPAHDFSDRLAFEVPALAHEAQAVNAVKRSGRFTAIIGNPPYSGHSANVGEWLRRLLRGEDTVSHESSSNYFECDGQPLGERNPKWLNDDYVKFLRLSERCIELAGSGVLGFITNHGYFDNPTFRGMRMALTKAFNNVRLLDLHGSTKKGERAPDGGDDHNVFDIQQGVGIGFFARTPDSRPNGIATHANLFGIREAKYQWLSAHTVLGAASVPLLPRSPAYLFAPQNADRLTEYEAGWKVSEVMPINAVGFQTHRDYLVIDIDKDVLLDRMREFCDPRVTNGEIRKKFFDNVPKGKYPNGDTRDWKLADSRAVLTKLSNIATWVVPCIRRPFDFQWYFHHPAALDYGRPHIMNQLIGRENVALLWTRPMSPNYEFSVFCSAVATDQSVVGNKMAGGGGTYVAPLMVDVEGGKSLFGRGEHERTRRPNLAPAFIGQLARSLGLNFDETGPTDLARSFSPLDVFDYMYAVLHSTGIRRRYGHFLRTDLPRVHIPAERSMFQALVPLGTRLRDAHLAKIQPSDSQLSTFAGSGNPEIERIEFQDECVWLDKAQSRGFRGVPEAVWNFHIGGYQICEKWLKDRKGRSLSKDDIEHYRKIVVAISETIRIMGEIDTVIDAHGGWPGAFVTDPAKLEKLGLKPGGKSIEEPSGASLKKSKPPDSPLFGASPDDDSHESDASSKREETISNAETEKSTRSRSAPARSTPPKSIDEVENDELLSTIRAVLARDGEMDRESLAKAVSKDLGFERLGPKIADNLEWAITAASRRRITTTDRGVVLLETRSINDYERDDLVSYLAAAMREAGGPALWDRDEAIQTAARYLGFRRTGSQIVEAFKSAMNAGIRRGVLEREGAQIRLCSAS